MNKSQAIKLKCLDCAGDSPKEVTLCHIVDCPLWQFRFGYSMKDKRYETRVMTAKKRYPSDFQEMVVALLDYIEDSPNKAEYEHICTVLQKDAA